MKNERRILVAGAALASLFATTAAVAACPAGSHMAGVVQSMSGPRGAISLQRAGASIAPSIALPLCAGDAVVISSPDSKMTAKLFDGTAVTFTQGRRKESPPAGGSANMLWRVVQEKIEAFAPAVETYGHGLVGRDAAPTPYEFSAVGLSSGQAKVSPGWSDIAVRWIGGVGPYVVDLKGPGGEAVQATNIAEHNASLSVGRPPGARRLADQRQGSGGPRVEGLLHCRRGDEPADDVARRTVRRTQRRAQRRLAGEPGRSHLRGRTGACQRAETGRFDRGPFYTAIACQTGAGERKTLCGHGGAAAAPPAG